MKNTIKEYAELTTNRFMTYNQKKAVLLLCAGANHLSQKDIKHLERALTVDVNEGNDTLMECCNFLLLYGGSSDELIRTKCRIVEEKRNYLERNGEKTPYNDRASRLQYIQAHSSEWACYLDLAIWASITNNLPEAKRKLRILGEQSNIFALKLYVFLSENSDSARGDCIFHLHKLYEILQEELPEWLSQEIKTLSDEGKTYEPDNISLFDGNSFTGDSGMIFFK